MHCPDRFVALAERLADKAGSIVRQHFRTGVAVERKADASPVTVADRTAEAAMRRLIGATFPDHGIIGEEFGEERADAEYVWVLDPIDGTKSFIAGVPLFGTLIALTHRGRPILGVIDQPVSGERWVGARGRPTTLNGVPARTRACSAMDQAILCASSPFMFQGPDAEPFMRLLPQVHFERYGTDCYAYGLLASGHVDLVVEADMDPYDYLAHVAIIESAGGTITDWEGRPLGLASDTGRLVAAGDVALHRQVLAVF